ncbi:MAG: ZIP family metal transporter [Methanobrevibacter sp.]|nr:ZIP family metal transporter [Methanobrevibacter sp.]
MIIPGYIIAGLLGAFGSLALLLGGFFGYKYNISKRVLGIITAFSSGILISAVCFELLFEAYSYGGMYPTVVGFISGVVIFTLMDAIIHRHSIEQHEKNLLKDKNKNKNKNINENINENSYSEQNNTNTDDNINNTNTDNDINNINTDNDISNFNIHKHRYTKYFNKYQVQSLTTLVGALLDGIPESVAIGLTFFIGGPISISLLLAVLIANSFEGASASLYMKLGGWSGKEILGIWVFVIILTAVSAMSSYIVFSHTDQHILAGALGVAAGSLLAMIADTMLPEAYSEMHEWTGFLMAMGFLMSFILSHLAFH